MAQPTNTFDTYDSVNAMREDLADVIYNIAPTETPFMSNASKGSATNTLHQWNTDALAAVAVNAQIEGDNVDGAALTDVVRLTNYTQICHKAVTISGTDDAVNNAGMGKQMAYLHQVRIKFGELLEHPNEKDEDNQHPSYII